MRLSRYTLPTLKENPAEAQIASHRLMLRAGLVRQVAAGIYAWLPTGWRVLRNIAEIVREEQDRVGAQELLLPTLQTAELWKQTGRYEAYGAEMLRLKDRHERELIYSPTNELLIADLLKQSVNSYRDLPQILYHIQWKFRDELRPRFGVMRGREFLMKDGYSFDLDHDAAVTSYRIMMLAYMRTFKRMGIVAVPMKADTGPIGGDLSHEFHILAPTGESQVYYDSAVETAQFGTVEVDHRDPQALERFFTAVTTPYAATDEKHDEASWEQVPSERKREGRGIEVGQIFNFGTLYSELVGLQVAGPDGVAVLPNMGSYGIGVSRLVGAIIEASHDEAGIIWPDAVAPFQVGLINLKRGDARVDAACDSLYARLQSLGISVLYDDREERPGTKFADMDLIGLPWQMLVGPRGLDKDQVELKRRASGERFELSVEDAFHRVTGPRLSGHRATG